MMRTMGETVPQHVAKAQRDVDAGVHYERATIFQTLLESDLAAGEKTAARLHADATAVLGAGTETTSWTLAVITFHLLDQPDLLRRLAEEVRAAVPDPKALPSWTTLEKLPFLGAVLHEGLRLSYGVSARTARVPTGEDLIYRGSWTPPGKTAPVDVIHVLPRGYAVGMSSSISHHDESVWPDSHAFRPDRWLDENMERRKELERCLLSFSKGSRGCLGMQ